jgi:hypothetical protein
VDNTATCVNDANKNVVSEATVDGVNIQNLDKYVVQSPLFNAKFPQDNIFGAPAGPTQAVSDVIGSSLSLYRQVNTRFTLVGYKTPLQLLQPILLVRRNYTI